MLKSQMTLLLEGIEQDDPTCFVRLGVCPNDHIYAKNALTGLQVCAFAQARDVACAEIDHTASRAK